MTVENVRPEVWPLPSSEAVEEAGHFEEIVRLAERFGNIRNSEKPKTFETQRNRENGGDKNLPEMPKLPKIAGIKPSIRVNQRYLFMNEIGFPITAMTAISCDSGDLNSSVSSVPPCFKGFGFYSALATNSAVSTFPALFTCTKIRYSPGLGKP